MSVNVSMPPATNTSKHIASGLWAVLDRIPRDSWPTLLRGDTGFGNEPIIRGAEQRGLAYLFKLRLTANVKRTIERLSRQREWTNAGQGWEAKESVVRLDGWSRQRRVIVLRRRVKGEPNGAGAASPRTTLHVAAWPRACRRVLRQADATNGRSRRLPARAAIGDRRLRSRGLHGGQVAARIMFHSANGQS
jgi:hypothetical protein